MEIARDILVGLSAVTVAFFAWRGVTAWRNELTGKARFEIARSMMRTAFELRANLESVRAPFTAASESADRVRDAAETLAESLVLDEWHAKSKRLNSVVESLNRVIELKWEAETLLVGSAAQSVKEAVKAYRASYAALSSAISSNFRIRYNEAKGGSSTRQEELLAKLEATIYSVGDDDFSKKVDDATEKLSCALRQYVK